MIKILIITLIALFLTAIYYGYKKPYSDLPRFKIFVLAFFRFAVLWLLLLLITNPIFETKKQKTQKPILFFAQDNSSSMLYGTDTNYLKNEYPKKIKKILADLEKKYEVKIISFGKEIKSPAQFSFEDEQTNFSKIFELIDNQYFNSNVGALIIASDGIFNQGENPLYAASKINVPIYTLAFGDTILHKDAFIKKIDYNKENFVGNRTPIAVHIEANKLKNSNLKLEIIKNNQTVQEKKIKVTTPNYFEKINFLLKNEEVGIHKYKIKLSSLDDEFSKQNNERDIVIKTHDKKQKILLVQHTWHPDVAALKRVVDGNKAYLLEIKNANDEIKNINEYSLVVLHQLPSNNYAISSLLKNIVKQKKSVLFILGEKTSINALNTLQIGFSISNFKQIFDYTNAGINNQFSLFNLEGIPEDLSFLPPLTVPFANYPNVSRSKVLFYQVVGNIKTEKPLIFFSENGSQRIGVIAGEGIWSWFLAEYAMHQNQQISKEIVQKTLQFLMINQEKKLFVVELPNENYETGMKITAKIYNKAYELITYPQVEFTIFDKQGRKYPHLFQKTDIDYFLHLKLPIGEYKFEAKTKVGDEVFQQKGEFVVQASHLEKQNLQADFHLLYNLAKQNGGEMYLYNQTDKIKTTIENNPSIKNINYTVEQTDALIDKKIIFLCLILLLTGEWFLRKLWSIR